MQTNILFKRNLESAVMIMLTGLCFGLIYPIVGSDHSDTVAFINGISIGVIGGAMISFIEIFVFKIDSRRWTFMWQLFLKTIIYFFLFTIMILSVMCLTRSIENNQGFIEYFFGDQFQTFIFKEHFKIILIYCFAILLIINFTRQINRKIGHGVLVNFILGKYHKPREEERIFAFIDLKRSTQIAESLGALQFHKLLREFFYDIAIPILVTKGKVYRYVGDEIVVSWKIKSGIEEANCIRSYFLMKMYLKRQREKYLNQFGLIPDFHAAFHSGVVVRGEIGDIRSQLVFHGETMFVASDIEKECGILGYDLLISSDLLEQLSIPTIYSATKVGELKNHKNIQLYTLSEKELPNH